MSGAESASHRADVKSEIARVLIDAMREGNTPWQKPWSAASMKPMNPTSGNSYRGVNRILLALAGAGRADPRWMTYQQAQARGWQVRRGEKGATIVKLVEFNPKERDDSVGVGDAPCQERTESSAEAEQRRAFALRRYTVFNASQIDGVPELESPSALQFDPVERAEAVISALREQTGLRVVHGCSQACYIPALDEIRLPAKSAFHSVYDYYATALHEGAHSTLHEKRMNRREAISKRWGDEAYAVEELRAEMCSAILAAETGVPVGQAHIANHAAYLQSWLTVAQADPMALFSAAKDAELMSSYMLGLELKREALLDHAAWIQSYNVAVATQCLALAKQ